MKKKKQQSAAPWGIWPMGPVGLPVTSDTDPLGMYTGNPEDPFEIPVQDADDL